MESNLLQLVPRDPGGELEVTLFWLFEATELMMECRASSK